MVDETVEIRRYTQVQFEALTSLTKTKGTTLIVEIYAQDGHTFIFAVIP